MGRQRRSGAGRGGRGGSEGPCIGIVSSCGSHLTEVRVLRRVYGAYRHFYVVNEVIDLPEDMVGRTYFIRHAERDWRVVLNFWEAWRILRRERPTLLLSTGAGPIVPFALIGKLLGVPTIYIENACQVRTPSLTGRIMYWLAERFFYQWPELGRYFPRGTYGGPLPWSS